MFLAKQKAGKVRESCEWARVRMREGTGGTVVLSSGTTELAGAEAGRYWRVTSPERRMRWEAGPTRMV
jgi:hypothetical protein